MGAREGGMGEAPLPAGRRARPGPGRLLREEAGAVAVIVALTFSAIFLAVAVAIDFARPQTEVVRVESAAAAAALAVSHRLGLPDQDTTDWQDRDAPFLSRSPAARPTKSASPRRNKANRVPRPRPTC